MSSPRERLDASLERRGEDVVLRRQIGVTNPIYIDVPCRARVRSPTVEELQSGYVQTDSFVIMSPTQIMAAQWPGGVVSGQINPHIPRGGTGGDRMKIASGTFRAVQSVNPIYVDNELSRIEMWVAG